MVCEAELAGATSCINGDAATCGACYAGGVVDQDVIDNAENAMRSSLAFKSPTDPEFCLEAVYRVCKPYRTEKEGQYSCCCLPEQEAFLQCNFETTWLTKYGVTDTACVWHGCDAVNGVAPAGGAGGSGGGGSNMMIPIIGAAGGGILVLVLIVCLVMRNKKKKRLAIEAVEKAKQQEENDDDDDIESNDDKKSKNKKKKEKEKEKEKKKKKKKKRERE